MREIRNEKEIEMTKALIDDLTELRFKAITVLADGRVKESETITAEGFEDAWEILQETGSNVLSTTYFVETPEGRWNHLGMNGNRGTSLTDDEAFPACPLTPFALAALDS